MKNVGFLHAFGAYFLWGVVPIFWRQIDHVDSTEIVAHRMVWSCVMVVLLVLVLREWSQLRAIFAFPKTLIRLFISSILISINWAIYIYAVNSGHIIEGSMGYFINPFISVLFGLFFFGESLRRNQVIAVGLAALGVAYLILVYGEVPIIALSLAVTFACYGAVKKTVTVKATHGMAIETGMLILPALAYVGYLTWTGSAEFGQNTKVDVMLMLGGLVTLAPLLFFASAAQKISLTALGMTQYLGPTLQLIIGVFLYNEPFGSERQIAFGLIWLGLLVYSLDQLNFQRGRRRIASSIKG